MPKFTIGLPAYNEQGTVKNVAETVSQGLHLARVPTSEAEIVLLDSESADGTVAQFESASLDFPREVMVIREGIRGKGINLMKFLERAQAMEAQNAMTFDADLVSITPEWIQRYVSRLQEGADYVTPSYSRNKYEGSATNHLAFPVIYATSGKYIRQPIGGDFALSKRFYEHLLRQEIHPDTLKYGIDIFFTAAAVFGGFSVVSEKLGRKIHKPSFPQLAAMFPHIANSLHAQLQSNRDKWHQGESESLTADPVEDIALFPHEEKARTMKAEALQSLEAVTETGPFTGAVTAARTAGELGEDDWVQVLESFCLAETMDPEQMRILTELYKVRITTFWQLIGQLDAATVEQTLLGQAAKLRQALYEE